MKLFISNLPRECTEEELREHFSKCGTPESVKIITDRDTGQSRGFGFIEMSSAEEGQRAIDELNEKEFGGRLLVVKEAIEKEKRPARNNTSFGNKSNFGNNRGNFDNTKKRW